MWQDFEAGAEAVLADLDAAPRASNVLTLHTRRWMIGAGGLAAAASLALAVMPALQPQTESFVTAKGQHQQIKLADGSVIDMIAETRLNVTLARGERRVVLSEGEAIFDVAHDASRPVTVAASHRMVRVLGTAFDVRARQGELTVTVARGKVQVRPIDTASSAKSFLLTRGQRLDVARSGAEALRSVDPDEAFSWRSGRLVYRGQPLSDVVAELNRQFVEQTEISDPALGEIPISGVIVLDNPRAIMARLSLMLPIRSVPSERGQLLLRK